MFRAIFNLRVLLLVVAWLLTLGAASARAGQAETELGRFFSELSSIKGNFSQVVVDDAGQVLAESGGQVWIHRPGRFRWDYTAPYMQQLISDGERVWSYDADLEQVSVRRVDEVLAGTPALLLSDTRPPQEMFNVRELGLEQGLLWLELTPRTQDSTFQLLRLAFNTDTLAQMELIDAFGQTTVIRFTDLERNAEFSDELFRFQPPPGTDVLGDL